MKKYFVFFYLFLAPCRSFAQEHIVHHLDDHDHFYSELMNMLTTLGLIVVIVLLATYFLKKVLHSKIEQLNTTSLVKVLERRTLSPKTAIYLLDIQGEGVIIGESINGMTHLGNFELKENYEKTTIN
jgi:flagellar biogenesis protein FliO